MDVYQGRMAWADYLSQLPYLTDPDCLVSEPREAEPALQLMLSEGEYRATLAAGLGVLGERAHHEGTDAARTLEFDLATLAGGVAQLNADFTPLLGDVVWKLEMQQTVLLDLLQEIRLAEFERAARAY